MPPRRLLKPETRVLGFFLNPWMLLGLAGVALPVVVHLLSRKSYDVVDWAAMQFLELDPSAKRRFQLEDLILLLVRMGLIGLMAVALARPWIRGNWLTGFVSTQPRDIVMVIDGSYSMNWEGQGPTPRTRSLQLARQVINDLSGGDTIQIIDARETPHLVFPEPTRDAYLARQALGDLPVPTGTTNLAAALNRAVQILSTGSNLHREVVILTDLQAIGWRPDDGSLWTRIDDVLRESPIRPRIWVVDTSGRDTEQTINFAVDRLDLSREFAVTGISIKIRTKVKYSGGDAPIMRNVYLEIDQQRLANQTLQIKLQPGSETVVEFSHRFESAGSHLISVVLDNDALPGDNRADAVVTVRDSLQALLVDGDLQSDSTKSETYFAHAAFTSAGNEHPWIKSVSIKPDDLTADRLKGKSFVVLANVATLPDSAIEPLRQFVASGGAVLWTLGDRVDKVRYREMLLKNGEVLFPWRLEAIGEETAQDKRGVRIANDTLKSSWLQPFRAEQGGSLGDARWSRWWRVLVPDVDSEKSLEPDHRPGEPVENHMEGSTDISHSSVIAGRPTVEVRLSNGDPLIVSQRYGRGVTAVWTSSLDADWNTLPAKQDYVPFLHELLFSLVAASTARNVDIGMPLVLEIPAELNIDDYQFVNPANNSLPAERIETRFHPVARLRSTVLPGVYRFMRKNPKAEAIDRPEYFAVNFDRGESDLTPLTDDQRERLEADDRLTFVADLPELKQQMFADDSRAEFWWLLLYGFLFTLVVETWMTRRMVRGSYSRGVNAVNGAK